MTYNFYFIYIYFFNLDNFNHQEKKENKLRLLASYHNLKGIGVAGRKLGIFNIFYRSTC